MRCAVRRIAVWLAAIALVVTSCAGRDRQESSDTTAGPVDIGDRSVYLICSGEKRDGAPTVVLVSGYHDSSDVWTAPDVLTPIGEAKGPPVFEALARSSRLRIRSARHASLH